MYASLVLYTIMIMMVLYGLKGKKGVIKRMGFAETKITESMSTGIIYALAMLIASAAIGAFFYSIGMQDDMARVPEAIKNAGITKILIVIIIGSIVEEVFFRGYLQRKTNIVFASFIFAYFHIIYGSLTELIGAFILGVMLGICYDRSKNLFAPSIAHLFYNLTLVALTFGV